MKRMKHHPHRSVLWCTLSVEEGLLDPCLVQELATATILVEMHEIAKPDVTEPIRNRFSVTHRALEAFATTRSVRDFPQQWLTRLLPSRYREWLMNEGRPPRMSWLLLEPRK
jgi:hypothetical protein